MNKFGVVRLDSVKSRVNGHIYSVVNEEGILENGMVGVAGKHLEGEREIQAFEQATETDKVALVAAPEINYDETRMSNAALSNFFIEKGKPARAYELQSDDIFSVSEDMVVEGDTIVEGDFLVAGEDFKFSKVASAGEQAFLGEVIAREEIGTTAAIGQAGEQFGRTTKFVVIKVIRNRK